MVKVQVKWGKEVFNDVELDLEQPPIIFKTQLFALTGVQPGHQKVLIKGSTLKDDDWGKQIPKEGQAVMLMGSAELKPIEAPTIAPTFLEDLPERDQAAQATKEYGAGLANLGNTCYMNSTLQCLYAIEPLRSTLANHQTLGIGDPSNKLIFAIRDLFKDLEKGYDVTPFRVLACLREKFPQFQQQTNQGVYMQQDAEECWTNMVYALRERVKDEAGQNLIEKVMGIGMRLKLKCEESSEEMEETSINYMLKCNISIEVNHLHEGILLGLKDDREKTSAELGRTALFKGTSCITSLPRYLTVQLVRFAYKASVNQKAKVLRKVQYPIELDCYPYCSEELQKSLEGPRAALKEQLDKELEAKKAGKKDVKEEAPAATEAVAAEVAPDVEMKEAAATGSGDASTSLATADPKLTGKYQLSAVLTHKGRSADSGHYTAWVRQKDGGWILFDDDQMIHKTTEDVLNLAGGGDWHMAYLLLYTAVTVA